MSPNDKRKAHSPLCPQDNNRWPPVRGAPRGAPAGHELLRVAGRSTVGGPPTISTKVHTCCQRATFRPIVWAFVFLSPPRFRICASEFM